VGMRMGMRMRLVRSEVYRGKLCYVYGARGIGNREVLSLGIRILSENEWFLGFWDWE